LLLAWRLLQALDLEELADDILADPPAREALAMNADDRLAETSHA
jgi:hypothetical protein